MSKKALLIQPGKLGDLVITTPIAKHYHDMGYEVHWPVFDNFANYFKAFDHINSFCFGAKMNPSAYYRNERLDRHTPEVFLKAGGQFFTHLNKFINDNNDYEIVDFCFTFPGHFNNYNNRLTKTFEAENRNWIDLKYHLAEVPLTKRWEYEWNRDEEKEDKLLEFITNFTKKKYGSEKYSIVHEYRGGTSLKEIKTENPINFSYIKGYEIYDWYKVLLNAQSIVCVDSCLANFVEVIPAFKNIKKHYLGSEEPHFHPYMRNILLNNWIDHSDSDTAYNGFQL